MRGARDVGRKSNIGRGVREKSNCQNLSVKQLTAHVTRKPQQGRYIYQKTAKFGPQPRTSKTLGGRAGLRGGAATATPRKMQDLNDVTVRQYLCGFSQHNHIGRGVREKSNCHPKESLPGEPAKEPPAGRRGRTRRIDVVVDSGAANGPSTDEADAEEGDINRRSA